MAERLKAVVLKTTNTQVFKGSNPFTSSKIMRFFQYCWNLCYATSKKIGIALFHLIFITIFCTLPHELGHALAANCFSYEVGRIRIGFMGSSGYSFGLFGYHFKLGRIPLIFGNTTYKGQGNEGELIIISAGLLVNLLLALLG